MFPSDDATILSYPSKDLETDYAFEVLVEDNIDEMTIQTYTYSKEQRNINNMVNTMCHE